MVIALPDSAEAFRDATWSDIAAYYDELVARPLDRGNVEAWLAEWSQLESLVAEAAALANFDYSRNTADPEREKAQLRFSSEIAPRAKEKRTRLQARLVELGYTRPDLETTVRRFRNQMELFKDANVPLFADLAKLSTEWAKITGAMTVDWDGEEKTPRQMLPFLEDPDRSVRERAFRKMFKPYIDQRDVLADLFDRMYDLRQQVARNAGFDNFRDYAHREKNRFDYTPDDCFRFHTAVEQAALPAITRLLERRRAHLGLERLRPWDLLVDPMGRPPLRPYRDTAEFIRGAGVVFGHVDPDFRADFETMADAGLLDLDNRKGKAPGGFCDSLPVRKLPLIFMNAVNIDDDVRTLLHESGHCFHVFEASRLPLLFQRLPGAEMTEVASMSMELLADPYIDRDHGGFYSEADAVRSRRWLLEDAVQFFAHCSSVDAFQHWMYTTPEGRDADARDRKWLELRRRFEGTSVDWSGLEAERIARWYFQPHFFEFPFYYIEYGLAQLGALQVWRNSLSDRGEAVRMYREALALGATKPLPELYQAAGARLIFDSEGMRELIGLVEEELAELDG
ncbi:MAG TPA: M3 family oligoendopeptidase [Candidatus Dormibacteraeota bacterium]|nr:M3 family oligoendopeptidase [Candidatus Dormibacteraeota bacterium]